jgi:opacity protein-like surface antigen
MMLMTRYNLTVKTTGLLLVLMALSVPSISSAQDEDVTPPPEQEKRLEWSGNLDVKYSLFHMHESTALYKLQFPVNKPSSSFLTQYRFEPYLNAEYRTSDLGFFLRTHATYFSDADASVDIFEAYGNFNPSFSTTVQAGKRVYNWGKGYAFNPVGFINPVKDPENPELAQAGLLSANVEYVKSFESEALQNISFAFVVIPSSGTTSNRFSELKHTDLALRTSFLLWDTDIDVMGFYSIQKPKRVGMDIARNVSENLEIHGELTYSANVEKFTITNNSGTSSRSNGTTYLLGIRYLHESNVTLIAEYYHNQFGLSASEFDSYSRFLTSGTQGNDPILLQQVAKVNQTNFRGGSLMKDYLYLKLTKPEPFDWLYLTLSAFTIYNVADKSFLLSTMMNYKPVTNIEFIIWPTLVTGGGNTEYGSKAFRQKVELWMRVFF